MTEFNLTNQVNRNAVLAPMGRAESVTARHIVAIAFRHRRLMILSFLAILTGAIVVAFLQPNKYMASMKILVKRDRVENAGPAASGAEINENQINSEVELIRSRDLLEKVVVACRLYDDNQNNYWRKLLNLKPIGRADQEIGKERGVASAVLRLDKQLKVEVIKKTNLISLRYESADPQLSARVLNTLAALYLEKHVAVHRAPGTLDFFEKQTEQHRKQLIEAQEELLGFKRSTGIVSASVEKDIALQKVAEFDDSSKQTEAAIAATEQRLLTLQRGLASSSKRMTTQVREMDDPTLLSGVRSTLLALEQKRAELLTKFEPGYRLVQQVDVQIEHARTALAAAEKAKLHEETTDRDPAYEWAREELEKAKAELAGLRARQQRTAAVSRSYWQRARFLEGQATLQDNLARAVKSAEENYLLYQRKEEEARTSAALDTGRILNVAIAEPATAPLLPASHRSQIVFFGMLFAAMVSAGLALAREGLVSTFRTPEELCSFLDVPVLAAIPKEELDEALFRSFETTHNLRPQPLDNASRTSITIQEHRKETI